MTLTVQDAHSAERVILVGCDDARVAPYAQVLRLGDVEPVCWLYLIQGWLSQHMLFDTQSLAVFVAPEHQHWFEKFGIAQAIEDHIAQARINVNTLVARNEQQGLNVIRNLKRIADGHGQDALRALPSMKGQTAVVCGAGPSLDNAIELLRKHTGPLVSVNTSAAALAANGVTADVIVCSESKGLPEWHKPDLIGHPYETPIAIDLMASPDHHHAGIGPALYFASCDPSLAPTARALGLRPIGYGPSCTTAAVSLCLALGAEKVLLVGQDCAFQVYDTKKLSTITGGEPTTEMHLDRARMYAHGTPYAQTMVEIDALTNRAVISKPTKGIQEADAVQAEGVDGNPVWTMPSMLSFAHWFRDQPESIRARVVNCSSHGVRIEGLEHRALSECVQTGDAYDGALLPLEDNCATPNIRFQAGVALGRFIKHLAQMRSGSDAELVEFATEIPLLNFWTNPAKLRCKLEHGRPTPYAYGKAIADAVRKAAREIAGVVG